MKAMLVYQCGIANVFQVTAFNLADYGRDARRLIQGSFRECELFARGLAATGVIIRSAHCPQAGDIITATWRDDLDNAVFRPQMYPITEG